MKSVSRNCSSFPVVSKCLNFSFAYGVEASNVINVPKCNKGPKCNNVWS